ncbi:MAG: anhydro-N-acetylmuramic acid kinase [Bacteroidia bacterium]|nr:anhydro-N-acetylmuramic acid kinase [Bacteroidia bacterium]
MKIQNSYYSIGIMSGTSLDGVDIALCLFDYKLNVWHYKLLKSATFAYTKEWKDKLTNAPNLSSYEFIKLHKEYGIYLGSLVNRFLKGLPIKISLIASHGHTIFHNPAENITFQIGDGHFIASETGITTISDFRTMDVAMGGQGAPLVPIGDEMLFANYDFCLNLGGIANVSFKKDEKRIAFDICPVNMAINYLANKAGKEFDKDGFIAMKGKINIELLVTLNTLNFYNLPTPKSLGREWFETEFLPLIKNEKISIEDRIRTVCEHVSIQIGKVLPGDKQRSILTTGGGALNKYLVQILEQNSIHQFVVPVREVIEFKEAIIFAFLGVLRNRNEINILASATGAKTDSIGGVIHKISAEHTPIKKLF